MRQRPATSSFSSSQRGGAKLIVLLVVLGVLVLGVGYVAAQWFGIPKKLGIGVTANKVLSGAPDKAAAQHITQSLQASGYNTKGAELYILPITGSDKTMAVLVLDDSQGFNLSKSKSGDPVKDLANALANSPNGDSITQAAVVYRGPNGEDLATVTAPLDALKSYAAGRITRQQLVENIDVGFDRSQILSVLESQGISISK